MDAGAEQAISKFRPRPPKRTPDTEARGGGPPEATSVDEDALTADEIASFVDVLHGLQKEIANTLEMLAAESKPVDLDTPIGRLSRIDAIQQQKMAQANGAALKVRLAQISQALAAAAAGNFGECRKCDDAIGRKRLAARPESPFCMACQGAREGA